MSAAEMVHYSPFRMLLATLNTFMKVLKTPANVKSDGGVTVGRSITLRFCLICLSFK